MMYFKQINYSACLIAILIMFSGAVIANEITRNDVILKLIDDIEKAAKSDCKKRNIEAKEEYESDFKKHGYDIHKQERWKLNRCGKIIPYIVTYASNWKINGGGEVFFVKPENEKLMEITYVNNVAMRNSCVVMGETKAFIHKVSKHRLYKLNCEDKETMIIECGGAYGKSGCWIH